MKTFPSLLASALLALPLAAWADRNPDFNEDAKPILRQQPGLIHFVRTHFEVQDTGIAKYPGNDDQPPAPPFIFNARPRGASGPFYLRLLIQPGPAGHILRVADIRRVPGAMPPQTAPNEIAQQPVSAPAPAPLSSFGAGEPSAPRSSVPTSETPSGPIPEAGSPSLTPPADPAPASP